MHAPAAMPSMITGCVPPTSVGAHIRPQRCTNSAYPSRGDELLLGVLAQQFVQIVAVTRAQPDERLVTEPGEGRERCTGDLRGGGEVIAAAKDRQPHQD